MQNINRKAHVGKSSGEKEAYKNFLSQRFKLDKTEEDPENPTKTDSSAFDNENLDYQTRPQGKSFKLKVKDFFANNWVIGILTGLIVAIILGGFSFVIKQNVQEEKISNVESRVGKIEERVDQLTTDTGSIKSALEVIKTGFTKDIQYIKERITGSKTSN